MKSVLPCIVICLFNVVQIHAQTNSQYISWLKIAEGMETRGYIPTAGSGVTIGVGVDLGQQTESNLRQLGVSQTIINKVKPYLGLATKEAVQRRGLNASHLVLSDQEATSLSMAVFQKSIDTAVAYGVKMTPKGREVLASLRYWAGALGNSQVDGKLYPTGAQQNHVWTAIQGKNATDRDLKAALQLTRNHHTARTAAYNRLTKEIDHL